MGKNVSQQLICTHLVEGRMEAGREIGLKIDQTLTQDATGTMVMLELEAMHLSRVKTELSAQYVDHNLLQTDFKNPDDHLFLRSACKKERFGVPGKTLLGSDSHTCAAGSLGMLAIGAGGLEVALAMAGEPFYLTMPKIWGVKVIGDLPEWVSAKDVILEMLRRHGVAGGIGRIIEYYGPGLDGLTAMDRHVIANMGAELGATTTVFSSDAAVRRFLESQGRGGNWAEIVADENAEYDAYEEINLSELEPLIACPSSPGNVLLLLIAAGLGILCAVLAFVLQRVAVAVAGWFAGGYLGVRLALSLGWQTDSTLWVAFTIGAILAAILVSLLFDWALIVLSALTGAIIVSDALPWGRPVEIIAAAVLFALGALTQARLLERPDRPALQPPER